MKIWKVHQTVISETSRKQTHCREASWSEHRLHYFN